MIGRSQRSSSAAMAQPQRAWSRRRRAGGAALAFSLAVGCVWASDAESRSTATNTAPLGAVLGVSRAADTDWLLLSSGAQQRGTVRTEFVHLRTPHGLIRLPTRVIAGIELAAGHGGQDTVVTTRRDCFQGFTEDSGLLVSTDSDAAPATVRREKLRKVVFRIRPGEADGPPSVWLVRLRDGGFFHGRLVGAPLRVVGSGAEVVTDADNLLALVFLAGEPLGADVHLSSGEVVRTTAAEDDLKFEADIGVALRFYHGHVQDLRRAGPLSDHVARRLGIPPEGALTPASAQEGRDPAVVPVEGMKWIPAGEFVMGSPTQEADRDLDEGPTTSVVIAHGYWLSDHEVTQAEYEALMKNNPSQYLGDGQRPVEKVNWQEALDYCRRLTERERAAGRLPADYAYRLPTEAEWEHACRAGTRTRFSFGDDPGRTQIQDYAWYGANSDSAPHPVRLKRPNPWGLHDLHGNLLEWCLDEWKGTLPGGTITNRVALPSGTLRVARGGSWLYEARFCRSANRDSYGWLNRCSDVGFRLALSRLSVVDDTSAP